MNRDRIADLLRGTDASVPHPGPGAPFDPQVARRRLLRRTARRVVGATALSALATFCVLRGIGSQASAATPTAPDAPAFAPEAASPSLTQRILEATGDRWRLGQGQGQALERFQQDEHRRLMQRIQANFARAHAAKREAADAMARSRAIAAYAPHTGPATPRPR